MDVTALATVTVVGALMTFPPIEAAFAETVRAPQVLPSTTIAIDESGRAVSEYGEEGLPSAADGSGFPRSVTPALILISAGLNLIVRNGLDIGNRDGSGTGRAVGGNV